LGSCPNGFSRPENRFPRPAKTLKCPTHRLPRPANHVRGSPRAIHRARNRWKKQVTPWHPVKCPISPLPITTGYAEELP
jgi:hypothetical protein